MCTSVSSGSSKAKARADIRRAIRLHTDGQVEAAVDAYRDILKRHPQAAACWSNLGAALRRLGRTDDGLVPALVHLATGSREPVTRRCFVTGARLSSPRR